MWEILNELWEFIRENRKLWMIPILFILLLAAGVLVITEGSVLAPLLYTLF
ncbi:MAG: DUF5989 family protein [Gammaproteobacteria bacterium]|nr:DUF5989 family protein [Gammaproteobacteria bacterium]